ncbi:MAG: glycosyltransferase family 2 protein [Candidatus Sericytochromatia bacterium]
MFLMQLSVIITTSPGREAHLQACLQMLRHQTRPAEQIWVVDDGSLGGAAVCQHFARVLPVRHLWRPNDCRVALSRNLGVEVAAEGLLVLIDSDMLLNPQALAAYASYFEVFPDQALYGYFGYLFEAVSPSLWLPEREVMWCDRRFERFSPEGLEPAANMIRYPHEWAWSGNFALMRQTWERVGGFDAGFCGWGGEDLDFASRLIAAGTELHFFLDAWAEQQVHRRDERFHTLPEAERGRRYTHRYEPAPYRPRVIYSEAGWDSLRRAIFGHYNLTGTRPWQG